MSFYKQIEGNDIKTARSYLNQLIDVLQEDISGSTHREHYQHFVTGGLGPGVTSSLYQTVFDQDFTLQTANAMLDITVGLDPQGSTVSGSQIGIDAAGKELFPSSSLMMREKMDIYRQHAQRLLGDSTSQFYFTTQTGDDPNGYVDTALFLDFKRLFVRDAIKESTFALSLLSSASYTAGAANIETLGTGSLQITDATSTQIKDSLGGRWKNLVNAANTNIAVGGIWYDLGVVVLDAEKVFASQDITGSISAVNSSGFQVMSGSFVPGFFVSGSVDNIVDHIALTRFGNGSSTAIAYRNVTNINSTLIFARAAADEFNYSQNTSYTDADGRIVTTSTAQGSPPAYSYITTIGLYDDRDNLLAVAKLSRPIQKTPDRDLTFRVRLDY